MKKTIFIMALLLTIGVICSAKTQWEIAISEYNKYSLPLVNIDVNTEELSKESYIKGHITIFDTEMRTDDRLMASFDCKLRYRGATSLQYEKKSFAVKLIDNEGEDLDANVFGFRKENDWILDAMAIDRIRMRNRVCFDIWNEISKTPYNTDYGNRNGTLGQFVEVYINENYHGLYCMTDKIDRKLLGLKKIKEFDSDYLYMRGLLYKGEAWTEATQFLGYDSSESTDTETWNGWELQYPDDYPCYDAWKPLMDLIDFCNTRNLYFKQHYKEHFYSDNLIDYALFVLGLGLLDNTMNNTFLSCPDINVQSKFLITPWDLDCSLGGTYAGKHYTDYSKITNLTNTYLYYQLYIYNTDNFKTNMKTKWESLTSDILSPSNFEERLRSYARMFEESGAWQREYERWNNNPVPLNLQEEIDYVIDWYNGNIKNVNQILGIKDAPSTGINHIYMNNSKYSDDTYSLDGKYIRNNEKMRIYIQNGKKFINK